MTSKELDEINRMAQGNIFITPKDALAMVKYIRKLEAIRDATIGLMSDGGNQYIDRLHKLLNEKSGGQ